MAENPLDPSSATEDRIRLRAYHMWEADGRPDGRHDEYWERARELQGMADSSGAGEMPNPMTQPGEPGAPVVEEAKLQENLGEFPYGSLTDQGDRAEMPVVPDRAETARPAETTQETAQGTAQAASAKKSPSGKPNKKR